MIAKPLTRQSFEWFYACFKKEENDEFDELMVEKIRSMLVTDEEELVSFWNAEGEMVGVLALSVFESDWCGTMMDVTSIDFLFIVPHYRQKGFGKEIVKWAVKQSPTRYVTTYPVTHSCKCLFESMGFRYPANQIYMEQTLVFDKSTVGQRKERVR